MMPFTCLKRNEARLLPNLNVSSNGDNLADYMYVYHGECLEIYRNLQEYLRIFHTFTLLNQALKLDGRSESVVWYRIRF